MDRRHIVGISLVGVCVAVASCSGSGVDQSSRNPEDLEARMVECMDEAGYGTSTEDVQRRMAEDPEMERAAGECASDLGVELPNPREIIAMGDEAILRDIACLEEAGWDLPEPARSEQGGLVLDGIDRDVPADQAGDFRADLETCSGTELPEGSIAPSGSEAGTGAHAHGDPEEGHGDDPDG